MTAPMPFLVFARDAAEAEQVELVRCWYVGDERNVSVDTLPPDKAIDLGLDLIRRGWRLKMAGAP